ncbi:MAG: alpha/beta hydrolase [Bacilli bacterium]|nr:alpha/beta hydrolase [Bacilli bacterium]
MEVFDLTLHDGTIMRGFKWIAEDAKANFCFMTGMNEHSDRYDDLATYLCLNGINVYILDALGQGRNALSLDEQEQWPLDGFEKNVEGIVKMVTKAKMEHPDLITTQGGHSMGSFLTQRRLQEYPDLCDKTLLIGSNGGQPGLMKLGFRVAKMLVGQKNWIRPVPTLDKLSLGGYAKAIKNRKTDLDWLSYNEANVQAYIADPYCGAPDTGGFWHEFLRGMAKLWTKKEMAKVSQNEKILILAGEDDPVGRFGKGPTWLKETYLEQGVKEVELILYPHMRHEIHNEDGKELVWDDIRAFLLKE